MAFKSQFSRDADSIRKLLETAYSQAESMLANVRGLSSDPAFGPHYKKLLTDIARAGKQLSFVEKLHEARTKVITVWDRETGTLQRMDKDQLVKLVRDGELQTEGLAEVFVNV